MTREGQEAPFGGEVCLGRGRATPPSVRRLRAAALDCHQRHNHPRNCHCNCPRVVSPNAAAALAAALRTAQRLAAVLLLGRRERARERDLKVLCDVVAVGEGAARAEARLGLVRDAVDLRLVVAEQAAAPPPPPRGRDGGRSVMETVTRQHPIDSSTRWCGRAGRCAAAARAERRWTVGYARPAARRERDDGVVVRWTGASKGTNEGGGRRKEQMKAGGGRAGGRNNTKTSGTRPAAISSSSFALAASSAPSAFLSFLRYLSSLTCSATRTTHFIRSTGGWPGGPHGPVERMASPPTGRARQTDEPRNTQRGGAATGLQPRGVVGVALLLRLGDLLLVLADLVRERLNVAGFDGDAQVATRFRR